MSAQVEATLPIHLLRLISPGLPVGAFSYSRGLEAAVHADWVHDERTAREWILGTLEHSYAAFDGALFWRMIEALYAGDHASFHVADAWLAAGRESLELQLEDRRMGEALLRLLIDLEVPLAHELGSPGMSYPAAFAIGAHHWGVPAPQALAGLIWSVAEGQVAAAIRLVSLGHTAGQRILIAAAPVILRAAQRARTTDDDGIGNVSVGLAMASAWHETQYSRLFRS